MEGYESWNCVGPAGEPEPALAGALVGGGT
jgi:hypothetical protein